MDERFEGFGRGGGMIDELEGLFGSGSAEGTDV